MHADAADMLVFRFGRGISDCAPHRIELLGGKGASLAAMSLAGFPVPPGFTISAACCEWGEQHHGTWPEGLRDQIRAAVNWLEGITGRTFGRGPRPLLVAVRSGAAVSMPGMMDTILNAGLNPSVCDCYPSPEFFWQDYADHVRLFAASVAGLALKVDAELSAEAQTRRFIADYEAQASSRFPTDPWEALWQCINAVFASWHSDRAKTYRRHHDLRNVLGTAVNVQAMFPSERSGVLFTANPNDPASEEMLIEASWGLGEAVVSGAVTPDIYVLDAKSLATKRVVPGLRPGTEPALTDAQLLELAQLGQRVAEHFGVHSDIEWGFADGQLALLQTRKIRGLDIIEDIERGRLDEIARLSRLAAGEPTVWVVHNLSETLSAPTPLTWDIARWFMSAEGGYGQMYRLLGQRPRERVPGAGFLELIAGRVYVDPHRAAEFHFGRLPFEYDIDEVIRDRTVLDRPPRHFNPDRADSLFFFRWPGMLLHTLLSARKMRQLARTASQRFQQVALPQLESYLTAACRTELSTYAVPDLLNELRRRREFVMGEFAAESLLPGFFGGLAHERLRQLLVQLCGDDEGELLAGRLTTGLEHDITVEQNELLYEVAAGRRPLTDFIEKFGHRTANEMELSQPRWREDHDAVRRMVDRFCGASLPSPSERHAAQVELRRRTEAELPAVLAAVGGASLSESIQTELRSAQTLVPYRELGKFHLMRGYETLRHVLMELGRRWDLGRDVFFLEAAELPGYEQNSSTLDALIERRKLRWQSSRKLALSDVIDSRQLDHFGRPLPVSAHADHARLPCRPIASGTARGTARLVFDPREVTDLGPNAILVCPSTDPGWTPLFLHAKGLIVERGGVLSHGAIVARDFGIPAVVLEGATQLIPEGTTIELDAQHGFIVLTAAHGTGTFPPAARVTTANR